MEKIAVQATARVLVLIEENSVVDGEWPDYADVIVFKTGASRPVVQLVPLVPVGD